VYTRSHSRSPTGVFVGHEERLSFSIRDVVQATGIGRTFLYDAIANGGLVARKAGSRTIILSDELKAWLNSLPRLYDGNANAIAEPDQGTDIAVTGTSLASDAKGPRIQDHPREFSRYAKTPGPTRR